MSEVDEEKGAAAVNASLSGGEPEPYQHLRAKAPEGVRTFGVFKLRGRHDSLPQKWWFASTAIPLLAATIGPLCNVLSIAALVSPWRLTLPNNGELPDGTDDNGVGIEDPRWEITLNAVSLVCGFLGNFFLLLNFTSRVRYIVALPLSIIFWILASGILMAIIVSMNLYVPPVGPGEIYSQGYWHAVIAAVLYFIGGGMLVANMAGYVLGHYPQQFDLDDDQRTLILQTMMFFFWLAGGAAIYTRLEGWTYANALYWCDVSILTIGFGDITPKNDSSRAFLFVFEIVGIIFLGLVISSISRFAANISADKIIKKHQKHARESTVGRTVTNEDELRERLGLPMRRPSASPSLNDSARRESLERYGKIEIVGRTVTFHEKKAHAGGGGRGGAARNASKDGGGGEGGGGEGKALSRDEKMRARQKGSQERRKERRQKLLLLQEEKDRFDAMREIQDETRRWKQYWALFMAVLGFGILWCIGALVFFLAEARVQGFSYFQALYFCFVSLLTIGYGDFAPRSNAGKPFFVLWSLLAVPTMTILIGEMSKTVVASVNRGTITLAEWTVLPKEGVWKSFLEAHPKLHGWMTRWGEQRLVQLRLTRGFDVQSPDDNVTVVDTAGSPTPDDKTRAALDRLVTELESEHDLAKQLADAIKRTSQDLRAHPPKRYSYEEWVIYTKLIRFSRRSREEVAQLEEDEGLIEWDWIGENSPMLADITEAEWVLDRLCESLRRYTRRQAQKKNDIKRRGSKMPDLAEGKESDVTDSEADADPTMQIQPVASSPAFPSVVGRDVRAWAEQMRLASGASGAVASSSSSSGGGGGGPAVGRNVSMRSTGMNTD